MPAARRPRPQQLGDAADLASLSSSRNGARSQVTAAPHHEQASLPHAAVALPAIAAAVATVPMLLPQAAAASSTFGRLLLADSLSLQPHHASDTLIVGCWAVLFASVLTTLVCTCRFLVS